MTNREWLFKKMQNMSDEELVKNIILKCETLEIKSGSCAGKDCEYCQVMWLKAEHKEKITLSEAERIILENIDKEYKWIARDENGHLEIYIEKPEKRFDCWRFDITSYSFRLFNHLFQFITWNDSEPYNIEELLKEKKTY